LINLEIFGDAALLSTVAESLDEVDGVSRVRLVLAARSGHAVVSAAVRPGAVDDLLEALGRQGVPSAEITLTYVEVVASPTGGRAEASLVWADVLGTAWLNAQPIARYLAFMFVAGVIACYGVIDGNVILIVGAMAVSPDLLPITAIGVGIAGRRPVLAGRALLTLALGLGVASGAAAIFAFAQNRLDLLPSGFNLAQTGVLTGVTSVNNETIAVALAAGVAGMLALETRASAGVGVAISVTTIPAAAYLGVAAGFGKFSTASGSLGVLGANVLMMVVGIVATLALQSALMPVRNREAAGRRRRRNRALP
jgi:uncharacterized hydrophobic protein (TIGR00271 family)